ncbi:MAG: hypothetical protein JXB36_10625 [Gammaproteobacteria bacterium]|nr:hypothetical protein [Gammaproteobacteria bacterium]
MIHLVKRFEGAVLALVGDGPIKQRLGYAYSRYLDGLYPDDLPDPVRERYEALHTAMHRAAPIGKGGRLKASIQKMSFAEASHYAGKVVEVYAELVRCVEREPLKIVRSDEAPREPEPQRAVEPQRASAGRS